MKSKAKRQKWWNSLNSKRQAVYVSKKIQEKADRRREYEETHWKQAIIGDRRKYCCKTCFHLKVRCCDGLSSLSKICLYWWTVNSSKEGLAYERNEALYKM